MQQLLSELKDAEIGDILLNEPMSNYTTWKIGGPADVLIIPKGKQELIRTMQIIHRHKQPWTKIGKGSNTLVMDKGIRGIVVKLGEGLSGLEFEGNLVRVGAAFGLIKLSVLVGKQGLTGLEFAGGIPGSVGGAVYMNAGAHGSDLSKIVKTVEAVVENGDLVRFTNEEMQFSYRHSVLQGLNAVVTEVELELQQGDRKEIAAAMATFKDRRLRTQPLQMACAGSVFRNPEGHYAAELIEKAGLKGLRIGEAEISTQHANFIVNTGNATARDVLAIIERVKTEVKDKFGIQLVPEVLMVGER